MLKRLVGYAAYMFGANMVTGMLTFAVTSMGMVTRSKEAFGDYATYMRIYQIGQGLFIFGANAAIQRFAADSEESRRAFAALSLQLFAVLLVVMSAAGVAVGLGIDWNYAFAIFGLPWLVLYWWGRYLVRSKLDARREARLMMIASISNSVFQLLFLSFTDWRDALIYGDFLALVTSGVVALVYVRLSEETSLWALLRTKVPRGLIRESAKFGAPVWWSGQIFQAQYQVQGVWTRAQLGAAPMGALQGMETMWQFAAKPLEFLGQAALPGLVSAKDERSKLYREILRLCLVAFTFIGIAVATGMPLVFELIDGWGHGGEPMLVKYGEVPGLLRILALGMPIVAFEIVSNNYSVAEGRPKAVLYSNLVTVAVVVLTLYPLATTYGLVGVVIGGLCGTVAKAVTYAVVLWRDFRGDVKAGLVWTLQSTACCAIVLVPSHLWHDWTWSWVLSFPAVALYMAGMFLFRVVEVEDVRRVQRAYRARRAA